MSLLRQINNIRRSSWRQAYRDLAGLGDIKAGQMVGIDRAGNKYFENTKDEVYGRHRWVDYHKLYDANPSQIDPDWHSWLHHIRHDPPTKDAILKAERKSWQTFPVESLTSTYGAYKPYSTTGPKINPWQPKVATRS